MQRGFTLIELAIVLVIIGLIVGGVLVGQDLIKAAQIRAVTTDIDRYNTAANAFQTKYGGIPGDLLSTKAQNNGLCYSSGEQGTGDGNGVLDNVLFSTGTWEDGLGGENLLFWLHLSQAQMIPFSPVGTSGTSGYPGSGNPTWCTGSRASTLSTVTALTVTHLQAMLPQLRIRDTGFIHVGGVAGLNYFSIGNYSLNNGDGAGAIVPAPVLTPREAQGIDQKLDDGFPDRGIVWSGGTTSGGWSSYLYYNIIYCGVNSNSGAECGNSGQSGTCYDDSTFGQGKYMTSTNAKANTIACTLIMRTSF